MTKVKVISYGKPSRTSILIDASDMDEETLGLTVQTLKEHFGDD
jgi:hypothetical protein